ncbi:oxidoreductase, partial [Aureobasidium melanogenum]
MHHILIVGGGPAGSSTAFWLAKAGFEVTIAERSAIPPYGQGIDITDEAVDIVKKMGLWEKIKENTTGESGFALLDDAGKEIGMVGTNPADQSKSAFSPTNEIEMHNTNQAEEYTAIIGADGVASRVRNLAFDKTIIENCFKQTDTYVAYFSMQVDPKHQITHSILQHANKGRVMWMRPIDKTGSRASGYLIATTTDAADLQQAARHGTVEQQKALLDKRFQGVGGIKDKIIQGMRESQDFYFTRVVQVRLDTWHSGRCALVGDAAYCPSPLTGQGTTMAVLGSYILAGELAASPEDPAAAFTNYRKKFEGFVRENGTIPLGGRAPRLAAPQSDLGIWILRLVFGTIARPGFQKLFNSLPSLPSFGGQVKKFELPDYHFQMR